MAAMRDWVSVLTAVVLFRHVGAQDSVLGNDCSVSSVCESSFYGCVNGKCTDGCTDDSQCLGSYSYSKAKDYVCNKLANSGAGKCSKFHCDTQAQCDVRYSDSEFKYKCEENMCRLFSGCECDETCKTEYFTKIQVGSYAAAIISVLVIIAVSLPCCCGIDFGKPQFVKIVGGIAIAIGIFCMFIPAIASFSAADGTVKDVCDACDDGCTDDEKTQILAVINGLGILIAYTAAMGFLALCLGPTAAGLGCGAICQCCGPLKTKKMQAAGGNAVPGTTVVGQPVGSM